MPDTTPKPFVFVLMPFTKEFDDVYKLGIKPASENAGAYAERVDEQIFRESILQRIYNQISKADIIVSDMTGRNPNVFYETGYAHALGKHVVLLTQNAEDIPFDLKHYPHIVYGGSISSLIPELQKRIRWAVDNPKSPLGSEISHVRFYVNGKSVSGNASIEYPLGDSRLQSLDLRIDANNTITEVVKDVDFRIAIVIDERVRIPRFKDVSGLRHPNPAWRPVELPEGGLICFCQRGFSLLPGDWDTINIQLATSGDQLHEGNTLNFALRCLTKKEPVDHPFRLIMTKAKL